MLSKIWRLLLSLLKMKKGARNPIIIKKASPIKIAK